jgi:iron complex transport system ATP-binding protein
VLLDGVDAGTAAPAVAVRDLRVVLGEAVVLDGVSADAHAGEWVALIGPNGAGKTTLLRAIAGLVRAGGSVVLDGRPAASLGRRELARHVALVPQLPLTPPEMPVAEYVLLGRTPHVGYFAAEGRRDLEAADRALARLDLAGLAGRRLGTLSGGERQRAVLARALAQEPRVLLLDEPTSTLDLGRQQQVLELVDELRREHGLTVLSAMHDLTLAGQYAERLVFLDGGRVVASGPPRDVLTRELISRHYGAEVAVLDDGGLVVVPSRRR